MKYHNKKTTVDGLIFDSKKEAHRWLELAVLQKEGIIRELRRQVTFEVVPAQKINGRVAERPVKYIADFVYEQDGKTVVEDVKGVKTPEYIIKRKLMLERFGIRIKEKSLSPAVGAEAPSNTPEAAGSAALKSSIQQNRDAGNGESGNGRINEAKPAEEYEGEKNGLMYSFASNNEDTDNDRINLPSEEIERAAEKAFPNSNSTETRLLKMETEEERMLF